MIAVSDFEAADLDALDLQPMQAGEIGALDLVDRGPSWSVRDRDGRVLACLGLIPAGESYMIGWGLLSTGKGAAMLGITRAVRRVLEGGGWRRVEITTRGDFPQAAGWARRLGFTLESTKPFAAPDGGDLLVWVRLGSGT